ncbi:MAG: DUF4124 domain-containing protein [Dokdonella sp.]|uniref:DUF4124 domain-containing protein n=1 Tax=Dokdonella sp. TaxID=2291710 RepID=UPI0025BD8D4D|nr:DUF4124 domain-containing protein [Dokdonella sp.]MBZ0222572.1 DUF4124 domain-containing protein [Dokdonella sp.]MCC7256412.1 DUF4124 domain-containing protein [Dokdonella sp.]
MRVAGALVGVLAGCGTDQAPPAATLMAAEAPEAAVAERAPAASVAAAEAVAVATPSLSADAAQASRVMIDSLLDSARQMTSAACLAKSGSGEGSKLAVQRWTDAQGIIHYSDRKPPTGARDVRTVTLAAAPRVVIEASGHDVNLPDQLQQRAVADALAVERVLHDTLAVPIPQGLSLRIVFVRSAQEYARLIGAPALAQSAGAYSTATRTIHVRMQDEGEGNFAVLRHEIVHALVHEAIGNLAVSINEGMAEYFGRYRTAGMGGQVDIGSERTALLAAAPDGDGAEALVDLLAPEGEAFYLAGSAMAAREMRYRRAFALVAMLMGSSEGRNALGGLLRQQAAEPCTPVAPERWFEQHFPGGLPALAQSWQGFMRSPPQEVRAY